MTRVAITCHIVISNQPSIFRFLANKYASEKEIT